MFSEVEGVGHRVCFAVFHSISAFCNAGFSLQSDSLVSFQGSWPTYLGIVPLIILGGLGFPVLRDLWYGCVSYVRTRVRGRRGIRLGALPRKRVLSLHSRLVLVASAVLITVPTVLFMIFETVQIADAQSGPDQKARRAVIVPTGKTTIQAEDVLILVGANDALTALPRD